MAHRIGALLMPAPPPGFAPTLPNDDTVAPVLDPALDVLGQFFKALIEHYCGPAWQAIAPGEPIVRKLSIGHDPEDLDFDPACDTPLLALWRDAEGKPSRLTDGHAQSNTTVNVLWVLPQAAEQTLAARAPFFNVLHKAYLLALEHERDPCWIKPGEESNVVARTYGSYVWGHAGLDGWDYLGLQRVPVVVPTGGESQSHPAYLATWTIQESSESDPTAFGSTVDGTRIGTERTSIAANITTATDIAEDDPEPLVLQQFVIEPDES